MVRFHSLISLCLVLILTNSCNKNDPQVPVLTTTAVSDIKGTSATSGGNITSDGGSTVTARGVCWNRDATPTIAYNKTTDGSGTGSFTSALNNLDPVSSYNIRAYATNSAGTGYGSMLKFTTRNVVIGENYQGGKVAYILKPDDPGYDSIVPHGLIAASGNQSTGAKWACSGVEIKGADGTAIGTGNQNTIDILAACLTDGTAARLCGDLILGGYSDWYLPSKDELNKLYIYRIVIGGFASSAYWSSSEYDAEYAWAQYFDFGYQVNPMKNTLYYVRAVRAF